MKKQKFLFGYVMIAMLFFTYSCKQSTETVQVDDAMEEQSEQDLLDETRVMSEEVIKEVSPFGAHVFNMIDVDEKPIFDAACQDAEDVDKCFHKKIYAFIQDNIDTEVFTSVMDEESLEQVIFVVNDDGSIGEVKYVANADTDCEGCQQAATEVMGKMPAWQPAIKDGQPVAVQVTVPIKFQQL